MTTDKEISSVISEACNYHHFAGSVHSGLPPQWSTFHQFALLKSPLQFVLSKSCTNQISPTFALFSSAPPIFYCAARKKNYCSVDIVCSNRKQKLSTSCSLTSLIANFSQYMPLQHHLPGTAQHKTTQLCIRDRRSPPPTMFYFYSLLISSLPQNFIMHP